MNFQGTKILITGASGNLGSAMVRAFRDEGALVGGLGWTREVPEECEKSWRADFGSSAELGGVFRGIAEEWGPVDILINNAGQPLDALLLQAEPEDWEKLWRVHLLSAALAAKTFLPGMMQKRNGCILNISSLAVKHPLKGQAVYASAKAGLEAMTRSLAREMGGKGIRVNAIAPGFIEGPWLRNLGEERRHQLLRDVPLRRLALPEEVAGLAVFLASAASAYITGQVIGIDGGAGI